MEEVPTLREISVAPISQLCMFAVLLVHAAVEMASTSYATIFILGSIKMGKSIQTCTRATIVWELTKVYCHFEVAMQKNNYLYVSSQLTHLQCFISGLYL